MDPPSIHDNFIYAYSVFCQDRRIVLHTEYRDGSAQEFKDVIFSGVAAHYFEDVLSANILFDIEITDARVIVQDWASVFASRKKYAWPDQISYDQPDDLVHALHVRGINGYLIRSSLGLSGWILASEMVITKP